jgi:hypothetical protein
MRRLPAILLASALVAACGGADVEGEVRSVASEWLAAVYDSDGERACALLHPRVAEEATRQARATARTLLPDLPEAQLPTCATVYGQLGEALGETLASRSITREDVVSGNGFVIEIDGDQATVSLAPGRAMTLERTADGWRVVQGLTG